MMPPGAGPEAGAGAAGTRGHGRIPRRGRVRTGGCQAARAPRTSLYMDCFSSVLIFSTSATRSSSSVEGR
ncbi:hypothetical protein GCM10010495_49060 [Kitasatospora herbaricolor]|nr:hypothetical protein GCM10010495_49060 [Kitasatospora herbaricolor]